MRHQFKASSEQTVFAWPSAEIAVMGGDGMLNIVYKKNLQSAEDKEKRREELKQEYADAFFTPFSAADLGFIDEIIEPNQTRFDLLKHLTCLKIKESRRFQRSTEIFHCKIVNHIFQMKVGVWIEQE